MLHSRVNAEKKIYSSWGRSRLQALLSACIAFPWKPFAKPKHERLLASSIDSNWLLLKPLTVNPMTVLSITLQFYLGNSWLRKKNNSLPSALLTKFWEEADRRLVLFKAAISPSRPEIFNGDLWIESGIEGSFLPEFPSPIMLSRSTLAAARMCALEEWVTAPAEAAEPRLLS